MRNIYNLSKGKVEVYSLEPLRESVAEFRRNELESLPSDERVLEYLPPLGWFSSKNGVIFECGSHALRKLEPDADDTIIMSEFINDHIKTYSLNDFVRRDNGKDATVLDPYTYLTNRRIQLTNNTVLELLLEGEDYTSTRLQFGDLSDIKDLFSISDKPITVLDLEEMKKYFSTNLSSKDEFAKKMSQINGSTKVYRKLR